MSTSSVELVSSLHLHYTQLSLFVRIFFETFLTEVYNVGGCRKTTTTKKEKTLWHLSPTRFTVDLTNTAALGCFTGLFMNPIVLFSLTVTIFRPLPNPLTGFAAGDLVFSCWSEQFLTDFTLNLFSLNRMVDSH